MARFYDLTPSTKEILETNEWCAGFSGGKDSTSMVSWIEWLRRSKQIKVKKPRAVISDTTVEFPFLMEIAEEFISLLEATGWIVTRVKPRRKNRLYVKIFGQGTTPVNPASKRLMRWCTSSTKVSPMKQFRRTLGKDILALTAVRWGESAVRDKKIQATCGAGGECGVQATSETENIFGPILEWTLCQVFDWLTGRIDSAVGKDIPDLQKCMEKLVRVYDFRKDPTQIIPLHLIEPEVNSLRFGCIGCPAIANDKALNRAITENEEWKYLKGIHWIWDQLRLPYNRCSRIKDGVVQFGPIKIEIRKKYFQELLKIQEQSGVQVVTEKDIRMIHQMWAEKVYPRGWSEADERMVELDSEEGRIL